MLHLTGQHLIFGNRLIQRCLICGELLIDSGQLKTVIPQNGEVPKVAAFAQGSWVSKNEEEGIISVVAQQGAASMTLAEVPQNSCYFPMAEELQRLEKEKQEQQTREAGDGVE